MPAISLALPAQAPSLAPLYNIKQKTFDNSNSTSVASSDLNIGNNLNITSTNDVTIQASNINTGTSDTTSDKSDSSITGELNITAKNLNILATQESKLTTSETNTGRTLSFKDVNEGQVSTNTINSELSAKNDAFNLAISETINASFNSKDFNSETNTILTNDQNLNYLTNINTNHKDQAAFHKIDELNQAWGDTSRGLTEAGTAVVAVAAVAATVVTAGALAPVTAAAVAAGTATFAAGATFTVAVAVSSAATTTLSVSATNASMNAEGSLFNQVEDVSKTAAKDATSDEALKSYAIAGATAGLTFGATQGISALSNASNTANAANGVNTANTATNSLTLAQRATNAIQNSLIQSVSSSVAQSVVNGDSFTDSLKNSTKNLLINAAGEVAANYIGEAAHGSVITDESGQVIGTTAATITKPQQLALHAALGCAMAAAGGNNCAAGAASGVIGEEFASFLGRNTNLTNSQIIASSQVAGALTAAAVAGADDGDSVFAGSNVAQNAAANNALYLGGKIKVIGSDWITGEGNDYDLHAGVSGDMTFTSVSMGTDGMGRAANAIPVVGGGVYMNLVPHGENVQTTISFGGKDQKSYNLLRTYEGGIGYGFSYGHAYSPMKYNVTVDVPTDKVSVPKFFSE